MAVFATRPVPLSSNCKGRSRYHSEKYGQMNGQIESFHESRDSSNAENGRVETVKNFDARAKTKGKSSVGDDNGQRLP